MASKIFFSHDCNRQAEALGGYHLLDSSLDAVWDGLIHDPNGFPKVKIDGFALRYIPTKPFGDCPALIWKFVMESNGDIEIVGVEAFEGY